MNREIKIHNQMRTTFPSYSCNEALSRAVVAAFALCLDPTLEELSDIKTAVSEAVTNAIVHGYPEGIGEITLSCCAYTDRLLEISVVDQGVGIQDIRQAREPMFTTGGEERSGMGFTIMEHFMTSLEVESSPGQGTTVRMRRRLSASGSES